MLIIDGSKKGNKKKITQEFNQRERKKERELCEIKTKY